MNIRLSSKDLEELQVAAIRQGIPYQPLMASILHRYVHGSLTVFSAKKLRRLAEK